MTSPGRLVEAAAALRGNGCARGTQTRRYSSATASTRQMETGCACCWCWLACRSRGQLIVRSAGRQLGRRFDLVYEST